MRNFYKMMKEKYKETKKSSIAIYLILRLLVIICAVFEAIHGNYANTFLCILSLVLFTIPTLIKEKFKIELPTALETIVYLFIFSAEILGEINNFYKVIPYWDTMLHTLNGFLCAGVGFALIDLLNQNSKNIKLSPVYVALVAFCFSMTVGVCWEFFEYGADVFIRTDMQKDRIITSVSSVALNEKGENVPIVVKDIVKSEMITKDGDRVIVENGYLDIGLNDTMKDLLVNLIGATVFCTLGYIYIKNRDKNKSNFVKNFIPKKIE